MIMSSHCGVCGKPRASGDDPFIKDVAANLTE